MLNITEFIASHGPVRIVCAKTIPNNLLKNFDEGYKKTSKPTYALGRVWISMKK